MPKKNQPLPNPVDKNQPHPNATLKDQPPLPDNLYWKGSKIYFIVSHNGLNARGSTHTDNIAKACKIRDREKAKLVLGDKSGLERKSALIPELLDDYLAHLQRRDENKGAYKTKTAKRTGYTINKHVRPYFAKVRADNITTAMLNAYRDDRVAEYRKSGKAEGSWVVSINRELAYLRAAMKRGMNATPKTVSRVPLFPIDAQAEKAKRRKGFVGPDQYNLLMEHLSDHLKPCLPFVMYSGVRGKELKFIRRRPEDGQIDWDKNVIHLRSGETKDGDARDVSIVDIAVEPLKKWIEYTEEFFPNCPWLFHYNGKQINEWRTAWDNACRRAGLQKPRLNADGTPKLHMRGKHKGQAIMENTVKFHDTRRTAITHQGRAGVTEKDSMASTGHKTFGVHRGYDQDEDAAIRTGEALNDYIAGGHKQPSTTTTTVQPTGNLDNMAQLIAWFKEDLLTEEEFKAAKAKLL